MAKTMSEAIALLSKVYGGISIHNNKMKSEDIVTSNINHKFREELLVPYIAITNNIEFMLGKGEKQVITSDGILCKVEFLKEDHICNLEGMVKAIYNLDCWSFIKKWFAFQQCDSMYFVYMKLKRI